MFESLQGALPIVGAILVLVVVVVSVFAFISRNYIKSAPNEAKVFYGRKYKDKNGNPVGFKVVTGGARMKVPIIENVQTLSLNVFTVNVTTSNAPNKDGVPVTLKGVANIKVSSEEASLMAACERFLDKTQQEIAKIAYENLEGHLRSIVGRMTIEELIRDRTALNQAILNDAAPDLKKLGLDIDMLTISDISDSSGYIDQLGKQRTAQVTRDAAVGTAEAQKESKIKTTTAEREATTEANANLVAIAESDRDRDVKKAQFQANVEKEKATANQAGPLATAEAMKQVVTAEQETEKAKIAKMAEVAEAEIHRKEKELQATTIKPADAAKQAAVLKAEGEAAAIERLAKAEEARLTAEGAGKAAAREAELKAEAAGIEAKLLAEAKGVLEKAKAYKELDEAGKFLQILEAVERILPSAIHEFAGVMKAAAEPFGHIDSISIVDFGGNGGGSGSALSKFGQVAPEMVMKFFTAMKANGIDVQPLLAKIGIDASKVSGLLGNTEEKKDTSEGGVPTTENKD